MYHTPNHIPLPPIEGDTTLVQYKQLRIGFKKLDIQKPTLSPLPRHRQLRLPLQWLTTHTEKTRADNAKQRAYGLYNDSIKELGEEARQRQFHQRKPYDARRLYFNDMLRHPRLSPEEEHKQAMKMVAGDTTAREKIITSNTRSVVSTVRIYVGRAKNLSWNDLIGHGNEGLISGVDNYDPNVVSPSGKPYRVSSFARRKMEWTIDRAIGCHNYAFHLRNGAYQRMKKLFAVDKELKQQLLRQPTQLERAAAMDVNVDEIYYLQAMDVRPISLSHLVKDRDGSKIPLSETIADAKLQTPEEAAQASSTRGIIAAALNHLNPKDREAVTLRFGLTGEEPMTLQAIADRMHRTRERIRQRVSKGVKKLRRDRFIQSLRH